MKQTIILLIALFLILEAYSTNIIVSGTVSGTWDADTVFVTDDLLVENEMELFISAGTLVLFQGHYLFEIQGRVVAEGEQINQIEFTVQDTTGFYDIGIPDGGWNGLWFDHLGPNNDSSIFKHCYFSFGKATNSDSTQWYGGAVCIRDFDRIRFTQCVFDNNKAYKNGGGIYARNSNVNLEQCQFILNSCGQNEALFGYGGGLCLEYSDAKIVDNEFYSNSSTGVGGGLSWEYSNPSIRKNIFSYNHSAIGGGMCALRSNGSNPVVNNLFTFNSAIFFGGGMGVLETSMLYVNNTVTENSSVYGGGLYFNENSFSEFKNCLVHNNSAPGGGDEIYIWDTFSAPGFYNCMISGGVEQIGGTGGGTGFIGIFANCLSLNENPFILFGQYPYALSETSICVNAGSQDTTGLHLPNYDLQNLDRLRGGTIDIGAYEYPVTTDINSYIKDQKLTIYPNPATRFLVIELPNEEGNYKFKCFNISGGLVLEKKSGINQRITLDVSNWVEGVYLMQVFEGEIVIDKKKFVIR